jgi:hypothetical protein
MSTAIVAAPGAPRTEWLSIREASALVGVSVASTTRAILSAYRRVTRGSPELPEPLGAIAVGDRAALRRHGRRMVAALVEALDAREDDSGTSGARASGAAAECGRIAAAAGMTLQETLDVFVRFRAPFLHELAAACRLHGLDAGAATALLERASDMMDRLLPAVVASFGPAPRITSPALAR